MFVIRYTKSIQTRWLFCNFFSKPQIGLSFYRSFGKIESTSRMPPAKRGRTSKYFDESSSSEDDIKPKRKTTKVAKTTKKSKKTEKEVKGTMPKLFETEYKLIEEMRSKHDAPVDTQGSECCPDPKAEPKVFRYQALIGLMLSSQTKDEITSAAMDRLKAFGLTPQHIQETSEEEIKKLIHPVGFYVRKAGYIKRTTDILLKEYDGDIPDTIEELTKLPGIGPKMGYLTLKVAWNKIDGIGVDVHVHRICNRLGWVDTKEPEQTRVALQSWLPREYWSKINQLIVGFGQQICGSKPKCQLCKLRTMCPSSEAKDIEDLYSVYYNK